MEKDSGDRCVGYMLTNAIQKRKQTTREDSERQRINESKEWDFDKTFLFDLCVDASNLIVKHFALCNAMLLIQFVFPLIKPFNNICMCRVALRCFVFFILGNAFIWLNWEQFEWLFNNDQCTEHNRYTLTRWLEINTQMIETPSITNT